MKSFEEFSEAIFARLGDEKSNKLLEDLEAFVKASKEENESKRKSKEIGENVRNVFKNFLPYKKTVFMIMILLVVQAYCMLSLPQYTSDIIDTGIQNKGQKHIVPSKIKI